MFDHFRCLVPADKWKKPVTEEQTLSSFWKWPSSLLCYERWDRLWLFSFFCCCCSVFKSCPHLCTPVTAACHAVLSFVISLSLLKFMCTESVMSSNHLILCCPLLLLPSIFPSIRVFSSESTLCIRWPKCWSLSISPSMNIQGWFPLGWTSVNSLLYKGLSSVFSSTTVGKHQLCDIQPSLRSSSRVCTWLLEKPELWLNRPLQAKWCLCSLIRCLGWS